MLKFIVGGSKKDYPGRYLPLNDTKNGINVPIVLEFDINSLKWVAKTEENIPIGIVQDIDFRNIKDFNSWLKDIPYKEEYKGNDVLRALIPIPRMPAVLTKGLVNVSDTFKKGSEHYFEGIIDI